MRPKHGARAKACCGIASLLFLATCTAAACDGGDQERAKLRALEDRVGALEAQAKQQGWAHWAGGLVRTPDGGLYNPHRFQPVQGYDSRDECENARGRSELIKGYDYTLCLPATVKPVQGHLISGWRSMPSFQMHFTFLFVFPVLAVLVGSANAQGSSEPGYVPCSSGPQALNQTDEGERNGMEANIDYQGRRISPETLAEIFIADCSARLAAVSTVNTLSPSMAMTAIVSTWQVNLDSGGVPRDVENAERRSSGS
jgi:hypothetical protein